MKLFPIFFLIISLCLFTNSACAQDPDLTVAGFDPSGAPSANIDEEMGQNAALRYARELLDHAPDPVIGNPKGTVSLVEFFDYRCPHCLNMASAVERMVKTNPNLRVVFKMFPILGPQSDVAARAALAANMQGKFSVINDALISNEGALTFQELLVRAKNAGMDVEKFKNDMNSDAVDKLIATNMDLAERMGINGTPTIYFLKSDLSGRSPRSDVIFVSGELSYNEMQQSFKQLNH